MAETLILGTERAQAHTGNAKANVRENGRNEANCTACRRDKAHPDIVEKFATGLAMAAKFVRENPRDSAEIVARTLDGLNLGDAEEGLKHMAWDPRISVCTVEGSIRSGNGMVRNGQIKMDRSFVAADFYDMTVYDRLIVKHPELFAGLAPIPTRLEDCKGMLD